MSEGIVRKKADRMSEFDIAKGIGMLCIIVGHMDVSIVARIVFIFHVPLFFFISGYFFRYEKNMYYVKRRSIQLLKPYIVTGLAIAFADVVICLLKGMIRHNSLSLYKVFLTLGKWIVAIVYASGSRSDFLNMSLPRIGAIWFLPALLIALIIVNYIEHKFLRFILIPFLAVIACASAKYIWLPLSIQAACLGTLFVLIGVVVKEYNLLHYLYSKIGLLIIAIIFTAGIYISLHSSDVLSVVRCGVPHGLWDIICACAGSAAVLNISRFIDVKAHYVKRFCVWIGENSLIVMCVHNVENILFPWYKVWEIGSDIAPYWVVVCVVLLTKILIVCLMLWVVIKILNNINIGRGKQKCTII